MSALATLALVTALTRQPSPASLAAQPIVCAPNASISDSGCGNSGVGNSGTGNQGTGNSGALNVGNGNSGLANIGNGNSGTGNVGNGNSGGCNVGTGNSGGGNVGAGNSGGIPCTTPPGTTPVTMVGTVPTAPPSGAKSGATLPLTGGKTDGPIAVAMGLMMAGAVTVGLANRRRHAMVATTGGELVPLSAAVGLLLTGRAKASEPRA
jgi:LPXTG-motif cell wall-anchored protein